MEALPGGTALFARAYQAQLAAQGKGGGLTGQAAIEKLRADMQKGLVSSEILRYAGIDASTQANKGGALDLAQTASQAEQARYQNAVSDLAVVASNAGVEEGFARIFRTLNAGLSESNGLVELLANGFNEATKWADDLILFPQSFIRALEGRDSVVADWLGKDETDQLKKDWKEIKDLWKEINAIEYPAWMPTLESTAKEISGLLKQIAELSRWGGRLVDSTASDAPDYSFWTNPITATYQMLGRNTAPFLGVPESTIEKYGLGNNPSSRDSTRYGLFDNQQVGPKESNAFGLDPIKLDFNLPTNEFDKSFTGRDARNYEPSLYKPKGSLDSADNLSDFLPNNGFDKNLVTTMTDARQISTSNQFNIQVTVDGATLGGKDIEVQAQQLAQVIAANLEQVAVFFPQKE